MRKPRVTRPNAVYHVTAKINRGEMALLLPVIKGLFLAFVSEAKKKYRFRLLHFCVMGNHVHIIIRPGKDGGLSKIMQWLLGNFARDWNKRHGVTGHLWQGRFFSRIIGDFKDFLRVFDYISQNPVKAKAAKTVREWVHGGIWHYFERTGLLDIPPWLDFLYHIYAETMLLRDCSG